MVTSLIFWIGPQGSTATLRLPAKLLPETSPAISRNSAREFLLLQTYGSIYKLRRASQLLDPTGDFGWLIELEKDLALVMQPRSKAGRFVLSEVLVECGLTLMTEADDSVTLSRLAKARQFRNGLMVAMLALHPIRLKNFASLTMGHDFVEIDDQWWIVLSSKATKEARPDERRIDETIDSALKKYLSKHRPMLARQRVESRALWISSINGQPMTYHAGRGD